MDVTQPPAAVLTVADLPLPDVEWRYPLAVSALAEWLEVLEPDGPAVQLQPLFSFGTFATTPGAMAMAEQHGLSLLSLLALHVRGVWGDVPPEDAAENDYSVRHGLRILSAYPVAIDADGQALRLWLLTEADRSVTTVLRPEDY